MSNLFGPNMGWRLGVTAGGILLILLSVGIFLGGQKYAEGKAQAMGKLKKEVVVADPSKVEPTNDGKLIHLTGTLAADSLADEKTGQTSEGRMLMRKIEMYQWVPGKTTTTKDPQTKKEKTRTGPPQKEWKSDLVGPQKLKGESNPEKFPLETFEWEVESVKLGEFVVPPDYFTKVGQAEKVKPSPEGQTALGTLLGTKTVIEGDKYYSGEGSPKSPKVGDVQIWYEEVPLGEVSILASQNGSELTDYKTADGSDFSLLAQGSVSAEDMLGKESAGAGDKAKFITTVAVVVLVIGLLVFAYGFKNARGQYMMNKAMSGFKKG